MPDRDRIEQRLQALWEIRLGPGGGADRPAYSPAEAEAMRLVAGWAADAGLDPGIDRFGNLWALPSGWDGRLLTGGSHVDTVPDGGRYDGALGTVLGLELAVELGDETTAGGARAGVMICAAEEAPRFGAGTVGSRQLAGTLAPEALAQLHDADGITIAEALAEHLRRLGDLPRIEPPLGRWRAHAEVHVAQRRELRELGIVTTVASPRRLQITVTGESGHAGEVSMGDRRDALAGAAEIVLAIERAAAGTAGEAGGQPAETVATTGTLAVLPGAVSVIPGTVVLGVDMRGTDGRSLDRLEQAVRACGAEIAERRRLQVETALTRAGEPVDLDPGLVSAARAAATTLQIPARTTWSGAGHDAQHLNALAPALLVFVPLHGGESHTPHEGANLDEIVHAAMLVEYVLRELGA
ncbi:MAG TPA: Zn-dependent hydrolase [Solirubrobacteraceae bacterium]|nr:Zn-dependent hydrolase [Solirubrobacteraceae bacterium]